MKFMRWSERQSQLFWVSTGAILVLLMGVADFLTGYELSLSLFYLAPIGIVAWFSGKRSGLAFSIFSAIISGVSDVASGHAYSHPVYILWNMIIRLGFFLIVTWLLTALHAAFNAEQRLARVDFLTGAATVRHFYDLVQLEIDRSQRNKQPITLVYLDLDNFKEVNDQFGHSTGDAVLRAVVNCLQVDMRKTDYLGRLGGDEFAILLPETGEAQAKAFLNRVKPRLAAEMQAHHWSVTFSIGVSTFHSPTDSVDEMVGAADNLMYSVKQSGKDGVCYQTQS